LTARPSEEHEDEPRARACKASTEAHSDQRRIRHFFDRSCGDRQFGTLELRDGDDQRPIGDRVTMNLARTRAPDNRAFRESGDEFFKRRRGIRIFGRAEDDDERTLGIELRGEGDRPSDVGAMSKGLNFHDEGLSERR